MNDSRIEIDFCFKILLNTSFSYRYFFFLKYVNHLRLQNYFNVASFSFEVGYMIVMILLSRIN